MTLQLVSSKKKKSLAGSFLKRLSNNTLLLFILPPVGYVSIFLGQAAYLSYFGINYASVRLSVDNIAFYGALYLIVFMMVMALELPIVRAAMMESSSNKENTTFRTGVILAIFMDVLMVATGLAVAKEILGATGIMNVGNLNIFHVTLFAPLIPIFILSRLFLGYLFRGISFKYSIQSALRKYVHHVNRGIRLYTLVLALFVGILFAAWFGKMAAEEEKNYKFINQTQVVLAEYGDLLIVAEIKHDRLSGSYSYVKLDADKDFKFTMKKMKILNIKDSQRLNKEDDEARERKEVRALPQF